MDEQLRMTRTGHSSNAGVCAYKRTSDKLKELTSDVLNMSKQAAPAIETKSDSQSKRPCHADKENVMVPTLQITGGTNITININFS